MQPTITTEHFVNDEGSDFATVTITWPDGQQEVEEFASFFDDPAPSASVQAASFLAAMQEAEEYSLEERLGPYGLEWEREQADREGWAA